MGFFYTFKYSFSNLVDFVRPRELEVVKLKISLLFFRDFRDIFLAFYLYFRLVISRYFLILLTVIPLGNSILNPFILGQIRDLGLVFIWIYKFVKSIINTVANNTPRRYGRRI